MPKTSFDNGNPSMGILGTKVLAEWLNKVFSHRHTGQDADGFAPQIDINELAATVAARLLPAGAVIYTAGATAPDGFLKANGAAVSRATYAALFTVIGTTYGAGDGLTTFTLPDLRGEFLRALDDGRGVDAGRQLGAWQAGGNASHGHTLTDPGHGHSIDESGYNAGLTNGFISTAGSGDLGENTGRVKPNTTGILINSDGGTESRPRNVALLACIKY